jgi:hypothetical protein
MSCKWEAFDRCDRLCGLGVFVLLSYRMPGDLAHRVLDRFTGRYGKKLHERWKLRRRSTHVPSSAPI